jgi:ABC-type molybdate transport system substrate-binding protein
MWRSPLACLWHRAKAFTRFLFGKPAEAIFKKYGFET